MNQLRDRLNGHLDMLLMLVQSEVDATRRAIDLEFGEASNKLPAPRSEPSVADSASATEGVTLCSEPPSPNAAPPASATGFLDECAFAERVAKHLADEQEREVGLKFITSARAYAEAGKWELAWRKLGAALGAMRAQ